MLFRSITHKRENKQFLQVDLSINSKVVMEVKVEIVKEYAIIEIMKFT